VSAASQEPARQPARPADQPPAQPLPHPEARQPAARRHAGRPSPARPLARHPASSPRAAREQLSSVPISRTVACLPAVPPAASCPMSWSFTCVQRPWQAKNGKTPSLQVHRVVGINRLIRHKALLRGMQLQIVCVFQHAMIQFHLPPFQHSCARLNQAKYCRLSGHKKKRSHVIDRSSATFWVLIIIRVHVAHEAVQHCSSELSTRR
jgi:hypothetical protein